MKRGAPSLGWIEKVLATPEGGCDRSCALMNGEPAGAAELPLPRPDLQCPLPEPEVACPVQEVAAEYRPASPITPMSPLHSLVATPLPASPDSLSLQAAPQLPQASAPGALS